jgi:hypothetical protein
MLLAEDSRWVQPALRRVAKARIVVGLDPQAEYRKWNFESPRTFLGIAIMRIPGRRHLHETAFVDRICRLRFYASVRTVRVGDARRDTGCAGRL